MSTQHIVLINIDNANGDEFVDEFVAVNSLKGMKFSSMEDCLAHLDTEHGIDLENVFLFTLSEFMDDYNNDQLDTENSYMGYVSIDS